MAATRIEINFNRLLQQCQSMAEDKENRDWRFDKVKQYLPVREWCRLCMNENASSKLTWNYFL